MEQGLKLVAAGSFCWNEECSEYAKLGEGNLRRYGRTGRGEQRFQCKACKRTFTATRGTPFYGVHEPEKMLLALKMLGERNSLAAIRRVLGVKEDTVLVWLSKAAAHVEQIEALLQRQHKVGRAQLDALWSYVAHKGEKGGARKSGREAPSGAPG